MAAARKPSTTGAEDDNHHQPLRWLGYVARAEELTRELAGEARTVEDLNGLLRLMMKSAMEKMLNTEMDVHQVRAALRYVSCENSKPVARDLKNIYQAATMEKADAALDAFAQAWDAKYPTISKQWRAKWTDIITLFDYPPAIRKTIDTTNAIESVNSVIRKFTRNRKIYPHEQFAVKLIYMAIHGASKKWTMPIRYWRQALNHFAILHEDQMPELGDLDLVLLTQVSDRHAIDQMGLDDGRFLLAGEVATLPPWGAIRGCVHGILLSLTLC